MPCPRQDCIDEVNKLEREAELLRAALKEIAGIAAGSRTVNSLPHIERIAKAAIAGDRDWPRRDWLARVLAEKD